MNAPGFEPLCLQHLKHGIYSINLVSNSGMCEILSVKTFWEVFVWDSRVLDKQLVDAPSDHRPLGLHRRPSSSSSSSLYLSAHRSFTILSPTSRTRETKYYNIKLCRC